MPDIITGAPKFQPRLINLTNIKFTKEQVQTLSLGPNYAINNKTPGTHFCYRLCQPQGHSGAGRTMSKRNSNDTIVNRTRDLLACSAMPQPIAPPRDPVSPKTFP